MKLNENGAWPRFFRGKFRTIIFALAAFFCAQNGAHAAITVAQVTQAAVTTAAATQTTAAFTPVANRLYLMWTIQTIGAGPPTTPTVACANGLNMVQVNSVVFATTGTPLKRLTLFRAMKPSGLSNNTCTITWGQTTTGHGHVIVAYTGADASGTDGSGAVIQSVAGATNSATAAAGLSISLAALQTGSATTGGFSNAVNNASSLTAGAGYTAGTGAAFNTPATSIRAEWRVAGSTTVNMTQSAISNIGGIAAEVKLLPTTTLATGTDPAAATIAPGAAATDVDRFTLQTNNGTEAITSVTVNLSTNSGVGRLAITDNAGIELGATTTPVAGANTITVAGMSATTALTTFKVRVTPLSHAAMPVPLGAAYAITAPVTAWAGVNTHAGSDTNLNALTIDNLSPVGATATSGTAGNASVTLGWTTSVSADFNPTSGSVLYRWTTTAGSEVPAEGSTPTVNSSNGTATVACVLSSAASTVLSGKIDGTGGSAGCNTTALAAGTAYAYKIFQKDNNGNYDTGITIGTFTTAYPVPTTTGISPTSANLGAATFTLTVNGTNFTPGSVVKFNGANRTTTYIGTTQLTASIPASDLTALGSFPITVFNPTPGGGTSNAQTFTVTPAPPTATTNAASGITSAAAVLNGTVSSNGAETTVTFDYGLTNAYGNSLPAIPSPLVSGAVNSAVSADLIGLNCNTQFHYRVVAANSAGTTYGLDGTFTTGICTAPFPATACAATRFNNDLGCTANDVNLTGITLAPGSISSCVSGDPVTLVLDMTVNFSSPNRYDVGIFIANDGKLPTLLPANGGAGSCTVDILPITTPTYGYTFPDLDGVPKGTLDTCGDGNSTINGGTGSGVKRMAGVTLPCYASPDSGGKLFVPFAVSWDNQASPIGNLCTSNLYPVPNTSSKCNAPASTVSINVVVLPVITKTNGVTAINPGANTTYTVVITNNSGGTLLDSVFTDPAVANLTVNSVTCAAAGGAACPTTTVAAMQGAGISIPSASLPNNSNLSFTINATVSAAAPVGSHIINTATVTLVGGSASASDDDTVVVSPSATKSFAPSTITEGAVSVLTVTLVNPTAAVVTGVAFTDTYPSGLANDASANGATTCGGAVTAANGGGSLALSGGTIPALSSCTVTVNVTAALAGSYTNSTGIIAASSGNIPAASATLTVNLAVFGAFNACDVAAAPNAACTNTTTSTNSRLSTRLAGTAFSVDLIALRTNGTRNTSYNNSVLVELLNASDNSGALDAYNCRSTWTTVIATLSPNPAFTGGSNGLITVGPFTVPNAYRDARVRVTNAGGASKIGCSTDNFSIRPSAVTLVTTANATGPSASATPTIAAGADFTLYATTASGTNYAETLAVDNSKLTAQITSQDTSPQSGGTVGSLLPATLAANPSPPSNNASYSEVGYLYLGAGAYRDDAYTSVDASGDCTSSTSQTNPPVPDYLSDVLVNGKYGCSVGNKTTVSLGRFIPHHFGLTGTVVTRSDLQSTETQALPFSYMDEPMKLSMVVTAYNKNDGTPQNYKESFAKLDATTLGSANLSNWTCTSGAQCMGLSATSDTTLLTNRLAIDTTGTGSAVPSNTTTLGGVTPGWSGGTSYFTLYAKFGRLATPDGPYDVLEIGGKPLDGDGVTLPPRTSADTAHCVNLDATTGAENGACDPGPTDANLRRKLFQTMLRFGRLRLFNAYGSELLPMRVDARTEYWDGARWALHTLDALTSIPLNGVTASGGIAANTCFLTNPPPSSPTNAACLASSPITPFTGGLGRWVVFDKITPQVGFTDLSINLTAMPWLRGFWSSAGAGYIENPTARLRFGSPKSPFIYIREKY